jgi:cell division protein FtsN
MQSVLLGLIMVAVGWLVIWSVYEPDDTSKYWWPFKMKQPQSAAPAEATSETPWRRRSHARSARRGQPDQPSQPSQAKQPSQPTTRPWQRRSGS